MDKTLIAHDFNLNLKMYKIDKKLISKKIYKKFTIKDIKEIRNKDFHKIKIFWGNRLKSNQLNKMTNLKYVHFGCKGVNEQIRKNLISRKIKFTVTNKIFLEPMISTIIAYIFSLSRGIGISYHLRKNNKFDRKNFDNFSKKINNVFDESFLIVGYGEIGKELVRKLKFISKDITILSKTKRIIKNCKFIKGVKNLKKAVKNKTFIINTLPLNKETENIFDTNIFKKFKKNCVFINVGRGDTINLNDLKKILIKNKDMSVAFDVYNNKYYENPYFPVKKNFGLLKYYEHIFTPHTAIYDNNYWIKQSQMFADKLRKFK